MIAFNLLIFLFREVTIVFKLKVKTALSVCRRTVANNEVKYEQNGLQSVVPRASCEWSLGVQHRSMKRYDECGCKLCSRVAD